MATRRGGLTGINRVTEPKATPGIYVSTSAILAPRPKIEGICGGFLSRDHALATRLARRRESLLLFVWP